MTDLRTKNRGLMVWPMTENTVERCITYGDKITQVALFFGNVQSDGSINFPGSSVMNTAEALKTKWPHINVLITIKNDGQTSRINPLVENQNGERTTFFNDLHAFLDQYPFLDGTDFDFERIEENPEQKIYSLYQDCYDEMKSRVSGSHVHLDLPPMTGPGQTVGPEKWCRYEDLTDKCDTAQCMTYGYAWAGSAPGSTSPVSWLKQVLTYAVSAFNDPMQVFTGGPAYGHRWQIHDYPENLGRTGYEATRRGYAGGFDVLLDWPMGYLSHTDQYRTGTETQNYVPFVSFYDEEDFHHWIYLHIYDYPGALDADATDLNSASYAGRDYLTAYNKSQKTTFENTVVDLDAKNYDTANETIEETTSGIYPRQPTTANDGSTEPEPYAKWTFNVSAAGTYDIVFNVQFGWWDEQLLDFHIDGTSHLVGNVPQWYPYYRQGHWYKAARLDLTAGSHTLELQGASSEYNTVFYGLKVCSTFTEEHYAGYADQTLKPRELSDIDKNVAWPYQDKFKLTLEMLRRDPLHVPIWDDDFRDWAKQGSTLPANKYNDSGSFTLYQDPDDESSRPYAWLEGSGSFEIAYNQFTEVTAEADLSILQNGRAGVTFGNLWYCINLNYEGGRLDLYEGTTLLKSQYTSSLAVDDWHTIRMRIRGTEVALFYGDTKQFTHTLAADPGAGAFGVKSDVQIKTDHIKGGDAYWYYPQEAFDLTYPDGTTETIGRIPRTDVTWNKYEYFKVSSGEEVDKRQKGSDGMYTRITKDWDYIHSKVFTLNGPGDYPISLKSRDIGVWLAKNFLGDADGFSLLVFPDYTTIKGLGDLAAYEFGINGIGMWTIGQEDLMLWNRLVSQI